MKGVRKMLAVAAGCAVATTAQAAVTVAIDEGFDGVTLDPPVQESSTITEAWSRTFPSGWVLDNTAMPTGPAQDEWWGWAVADLGFWVDADDQGRSLFDKGSGNAMIADSDELDDYFDLTDDSYDSSITTPDIEVTGRGFLKLTFDSHFGSYDVSKGEVFVDFDNAAEQAVVTLDSAVIGNNNTIETADAEVNDTISVDVPVPSGATTANFRFRYSGADNDWFWAIDNVVVVVFDQEGEATDEDGDGLSLAEENALGTSDTSADTDGDGLGDFAEVNTYNTNPTLADTDGDGVSDGNEVNFGSDPLDAADTISVPAAGGIALGGLALGLAALAAARMRERA